MEEQIASAALPHNGNYSTNLRSVEMEKKGLFSFDPFY